MAGTPAAGQKQANLIKRGQTKSNVVKVKVKPATHLDGGLQGVTGGDNV